MFTIPRHRWFMALVYPRYSYSPLVDLPRKMPSERSGPASLGIAFGHVHVGHRAVHTATTLQCHAAGAGDIRAEGSERPAAWKSFFLGGK